MHGRHVGSAGHLRDDPLLRFCRTQVTHISPSRGFCIELSTSLVVSMASVLGLPVSSTHTLVGATAGV